MATLTLGLTSTPATGSKSFTLTDAHVVRWIAALRAKIGSPASGMTDQQVLLWWSDDVVNQAKMDTLRHERKLAEAAVATIEIS